MILSLNGIGCFRVWFRVLNLTFGIGFFLGFKVASRETPLKGQLGLAIFAVSRGS